MKRYNTGEPCRNGHLSDRRISTGECIRCARESQIRWKLRNPEAHAEQKRKWALKRPNGYNEKARSRMREYYRKKHGIPSATRVVPENCECCNKKLLGGKLTHLDHCHVTGRFRGWLCNRCNRGLGYFGDNIEGLQRAIEYLARSLSD